MMISGNYNQRQAGILLAISSLPGNHGIGDLGECAYQFIDLSKKAGFKIWQILPLNPSSEGDSPYSPYSSFAGDEIYISLDLLTKWHLLETVPTLKSTSMIDYDSVRLFKHTYLIKAFQAFKKQVSLYQKEYDAFLKEAFWLEDYCQFMALNKKNLGKKWNEWQDLKLAGLEQEIEYLRFVQFIFMKQFKLLKDYANDHDLLIMGDMPFYVGYDSADVYSHQACFMLGKDLLPLYVSGASPDYFSKDGQLWNHPIYNWSFLTKSHYQYWIDKLKWNQKLFDILRIDHFRAFDTYWQVPYGSINARNGKWVEAPGYDFFDTLFKELPDISLIVEDLGDLRPEVHSLRDHYHLMGMRVMEYSFGENEEREHFKMPEYCVVYAGTHDNAPLKGWYECELDEGYRKRIDTIMQQWHYPEMTTPEKVLHRTFDCEANIAICSVQDMLGYGNEARLNLPGTSGKPNWCWKLKDLNDYQNHLEQMQHLLKQTHRL